MRILGCCVVMAALVVACGSGVKPGLGVTVRVEGNTLPDERVRSITLSFDHPMVPSGSIGRGYIDRHKPPFRITPKVEGKLRWQEDRKLVFEPAKPLPRSTKYVITVARGTVAQDGFGLTKDFTHTFETERLRLRTQFQRDWDLPDPKTWSVLDQQIMLTFNQPVKVADVTAKCAYRSADKRISARIDSREGEGPSASHLLVGPQPGLQPGTLWVFGCDDDLSAAEGALGMATDSGQGHEVSDSIFLKFSGASPSGRLALRTFGPMGIDSVTPAGQDVDPDEDGIAINFTNPPVLGDKAPAIKITPAPRDMHVSDYVNGRTLNVAVQGLQPRTKYTVHVPAGVADAFGQKNSKARDFHFKTGDVQPGFSLETGSWSVETERGRYVAWARNVERIDLTAAAISPDQLFDLLPALDWWNDRPVDLAELKIPAIDHVVPWKGAENQWSQFALDPKTWLGEAAGSTRFFYFAASVPEVKTYDGKRAKVRKVLLNLTNLGLSTKMASGSGLVWVTRLDDGHPQPGATVIVRARSGQVLWRGRTDAEGIARPPGLAELRAKRRVPKGETARGDGAQEDEEEGWEERQERIARDRLLVFAKLGDDMTFVDPEHTGGLSPWSFGVSPDYSSSTERLRGFVHTDRGLYRPGDEVQMRGLLRKMKLGEGLTQPAKRSVRVVVKDPRGEQLLSETLKLSAFGSWHLTLPVAEAAALGDYRIEAATEHGSFFETFTVEEFREATFEVKAGTKSKRAYTGDTLSLTAQGDYFYGAPVRGGTLKWRVHAKQRDVRFPQHSGFSFADARDYYREVRPYGVESFITEAETKLDDQGRATLELPLAEESFGEPSTLMVSATVQDETNQSVSANLSMPVHHSKYYFGIDTGGWVIEAKKKHTLRLIAVNAKGNAIAARPTFKLMRHRWNCAWERWGYRGSYRCDSKTTEIEKKRLQLPKGGALEHTIEVPEGGEYYIVLQGKDRMGHPVVASSEIWARGEGDSPWRVDDSGRFEMVPDKSEYAVGDTAHLLVKAPVEGATALVTIEREGVLQSRLITDLKAGASIDVPITEAFAPNAYVSVVLARGRTGKTVRGLPKLTMGLTNLKVAHAHRKLSVEVTTDRKDYRPGDPVQATLKVTDAQGQPVQAEVALAAADEGVLSLIGFKTPDPMSRFYSQWGIGVRSATQYERLAQVPEPEAERYTTGGDGAGRPGTLRSRFRATAYWNPAIETDAQGQAQVSFEAPDNLTAYRLMAVAADMGERFGSGEKRFVVNKPLQILDALPRFANVGDAFQAAVLIANETDRAGKVRVRMEVQGVEAEGGLSQTIDIGARARRRVSFAVKVGRAGTARFRFFADMGEQKDGFEKTLPLHYPSTEESQLVSQGYTESETVLPVVLPQGVLAHSAHLELSVDPDGLAGIEESLRDLISYPYGCLEQTTSRLIPLVAVQEISDSLGIEDLGGEKLQRYIRIAIGKIGRHQSVGGGFSLWPGGDPDVYLTAFALWGLHLSKEAGHEVNATTVDKGLAYLREQLSGSPRSGSYYSMGGELADRAFALHVMSMHGAKEPAFATALYQRAGELPFYGMAMLARSLASATKVDNPLVTGLLDGVLETLQRSDGGAIVQEPTALPWYMSSNVRTTAIVLDTLIELRPDDPRIGELMRGLLSARSARGTWRTTQENLFALTALTHAVKSTSRRPAAVTVMSGDEELLSATLPKSGGGRLRHVTVKLSGGAHPPLTIRADKGGIHYLARLRFQRDSDHQPALSEGFTLSRRITDPESGAVLDRVTEGKLVKVEVKLGLKETREHVAVSDYLPAGLEAVNGQFATTADALPGQDGRNHQWWITHQELRDNRVSAFAEYLWSSDRSFSYYARATTPGTFVVPSATIEAMYRPELRARTALGRFEVLAR